MAGEEGRSPPRWALVLGLILLIALGIFVSWPEPDSAKRPERSQEPVRSPLRSPASSERGPGADPRSRPTTPLIGVSRIRTR